MIARFKALRLFLPLVAIAVALALFLGVGLVISLTQRGSGVSGPCDPVLGVISDSGGAGLASVTDPGQLSDEQRQNASIIIGVAKGMGLPPRAWMIALATAMQESTLHNLPYGDR
jgi:hypothetical protein